MCVFIERGFLLVVGFDFIHRKVIRGYSSTQKNDESHEDLQGPRGLSFLVKISTEG